MADIARILPDDARGVETNDDFASGDEVWACRGAEAMKPSKEAIEAAENAYKNVWARGPVKNALSVNSVEVALEAAYSIDLAPLLAEIERLSKEVETLRNAVCGKCGRALPPDGDCFGCSYDRVLSNGTANEEWLCIGCNTVYPGPPQKGSSCVACPRCGGDCGPLLIMRNRLLTAELAEARRLLVGCSNGNCIHRFNHDPKLPVTDGICICASQIKALLARAAKD